MQQSVIYKRLCDLLNKERVLVDEPMSRHTTFRVGGPADLFISIESTKELSDVVRILSEEDADYYILGNGSNVLVADSGLRGVVIELGRNFADVELIEESDDSVYIQATAGCLLSSLAAFACKNGLTGLEFAAGIPGTVGGAMVMNAGAYDGEMKDVVSSVTVYDMSKHESVALSNDEMHFDYRHSVLKEKEGLIVTSVIYRLVRGDMESIKAKMDDFSQRRRSKQPLEYPSAGSTFKRPAGFFAGKLIEDSGLRGYSVGGAQVSEKHCGFVINRGNATAADIKNLIGEVREAVYADTGVRLETEVLMLGEF